jgi:gas vesicle protein
MSKTSGETSFATNDTTGILSSDLSKLLIGAAAGAVVGSLVAGSFTEKGIEIRNRISESGRNLGSDLKDKVSDMKGAIANKYESARESAASLLEKGKLKVGISSANAEEHAVDQYNGAAETGGAVSGTSIILGALIVSVASTIVWSFATERGNETRRRLARGTADLAGNVKSKVSDVASGLADTLSDTYQAAKEGAADMLDQLKEKTDTASGKTSNAGSGSASNA